jgi:hypothetical protein
MKQVALPILVCALLIGCSTDHGSRAQLLDGTEAHTTNSFGIYLTVGRVSLASISNNLSAVALVSPAVISEADVAAVDLQSGLMKLKGNAHERVPQASPEMPQFVVVADGERLFLGAFGTTRSSRPGPDGNATIVVDGAPEYLSLGWNDPGGGRGGYGWWLGKYEDPSDLWSDPRLKSCLGRLHKLQKISL